MNRAKLLKVRSGESRGSTPEAQKVLQVVWTPMTPLKRGNEHSEVKRPAPNHRASSSIVNLLLPDVCLPSFCVSAARLRQMPFWSFKKTLTLLSPTRLCHLLLSCRRWRT